MNEDWRSTNLANWESRVAVHLGPGGYDVEAFADPDHISDVVRYDRPRLGRLDGLDVVHLQCHLGTDTVSLARLGARSVTGLDFSPSALATARTLATRAGADVTFVQADVDDAVTALGAGRFDVVYTGIGAICWLPDIRRWAGVVAGLLRPGGRLFIRDGHPMMLALMEGRTDGLLVVEYPYFEGPGIESEEEHSYLGTDRLTAGRSVSFNHGLGEIVSAVLEAGLHVTGLDEHREVPWDPFGSGMTPSPDHPGEFVLAEGPDRVPLTFTLQAVKPA